MKTIQVVVDDKLYEKIKALAEESMEPVSQFLRKFLTIGLGVKAKKK